MVLNVNSVIVPAIKHLSSSRRKHLTVDHVRLSLQLSCIHKYLLANFLSGFLLCECVCQMVVPSVIIVKHMITFVKAILR